MAVRMDKAWQPLDARTIARLPAHLGVYQLADADERIVYIGVADARTLFGLREKLTLAEAEPPSGATLYRIESTTAYRTRHLELLQAYVYDHGQLPAGNTDLDIRRLGVLRPY